MYGYRNTGVNLGRIQEYRNVYMNESRLHIKENRNEQENIYVWTQEYRIQKQKRKKGFRQIQKYSQMFK